MLLYTKNLSIALGMKVTGKICDSYDKSFIKQENL